MAVSKIPTPTQPPRLMIGIDNGRGASTSITYSPMRSPVVKPDDALGGKAFASTNWVVASHSTTDLLDTPQTVSTTSYQYLDPKFLKENLVGATQDGQYGFRGFGKITTTLPSGAWREDEYTFTLDPTGRLTKSTLHPKPSESATDVRTIDAATWSSFQLFNGTITTYHPTTQEHFVCSNGQSTCTSSTAAGYTKTLITMTALSSSVLGGTALMYQQTQRKVQSAATEADGDRRYDTGYFLKADGLSYRLVTEDETSLQRVTGVYTTFAKHTMKWTDSIEGDTSYRVPYKDTIWVDNVLANALTTFRTYDLATGNVKKIWKPKQWALNENQTTNLAMTSFDYDARLLFVARETNEVGHVRDYTWEYGTGTKLMTLGPNAPLCSLPIPNTCPSGEPLKEEHKIRVDGLGRMIERYEAFGNDGQEYRRRKVETNVYVDGPYPTVASITHENAIDYNDYTQTVRYTRDKTDLDGHGRPTRKTNYVFGSAPVDAISTFQYANDETLSTVTVPDPTVNTSATVTYTYTFDSLGRPASIRRPDNATPSQQSGIDISFNGLTKTQTEVVGAAGGQVAVTTTRTDAFDRLIEVKEKLTATPTWATSTYLFDGNDNVKQITDAQSAVTTLAHDFANRRMSITRASKTWLYGYDRNGNMVSEQTPCTPAGSCEANHTSTFVYDNLDRVSSKLNAPRTLSTADLNLFGSSSETFSYDGGTNGIGRMSDWRTFAPGAGTPTQEIIPSYNVQGQQELVAHYQNAAGYSGLQRNFLRFYNLQGSVIATYYGDVVGTQNCLNGSYSEHSFDARGLPYSVIIESCLYDPNTTLSWMVNDRNVAGLVTKRFSQAGVGPITYAESVWTYDKLGRVDSQTVKKGASLDQVVKQQLTYFGNDDPATLVHWLGATNQKRFLYTYDLRHQLTNVAENILPNAFTATYGYGTAGRFASANVNAASLPNGDVKVRNVNYIYSGSDPEQLTTLKTVQGNKTWASYTYDLAGNQLSRDYPNNPHPSNEHWDYVYDGKNQLRRVTKKVNGAVQGSEEYWYDYQNTRTLVVTRNAGGTKTGARWFVEDTEAEYDATGNVTRAYGHVAMGTPVFRFDRSTDGPSTVEYQFHGLASNTIAAIAQVSGTINASFTYTPFGEIVEGTNVGGSSAGIAVHRRRMNDKFVDDVSGLAYYGYRYYDKHSMTWTQGDPLYRLMPDAAFEAPRRSLLYTHDLNNPLRYLDPDGHSPAAAGAEAREFVYEVTDEAVQQLQQPDPVHKGAGLLLLAIAAGAAVVVGANELSGGSIGYERCMEWLKYGPTNTTSTTPYRDEEQPEGQPRILRHPPGDPRMERYRRDAGGGDDAPTSDAGHSDAGHSDASAPDSSSYGPGSRDPAPTGQPKSLNFTNCTTGLDRKLGTSNAQKKTRATQSKIDFENPSLSDTVFKQKMRSQFDADRE